MLVQLQGLWFDVEKKNYTTASSRKADASRLWFDVEKKNYTTMDLLNMCTGELWFDVEKKNYTTPTNHLRMKN